ncbi:glycoside hydrolase family 3 protein, partial [Desulfovibrio sp. OttesenSCG-928-C06]|nr:glycoside hydrolase family 3 protein [Desulfovibrio sp. OttesenSCG-928-C06]
MYQKFKIYGDMPRRAQKFVLVTALALVCVWMPTANAQATAPVSPPASERHAEAGRTTAATHMARLEESVVTSNVSTEEMLAQMLLIGFRGLGPGESEYAEDYAAFREFISQGKAGGVIFFNRDHSSGSKVRNVLNPAQLRAMCADLQAAAPYPLFISIDQEGGRVRRLRPEAGFADLPAPAELGAMANESVRQTGRNLGLELRELGINIDFAPSLDLNVNPENPVIGALGRSFGRNPEEVAARAGAFMSGMNSAGVIGSYKHFPGHGSSRSDTHVEFTDISETWQEFELEPYKRLLEPRGPYMVMLGHLFHKDFDKVYPASLSHAIASGLLRDRLGWQGVIISDDLQMKAIADHYSLEETIRLAVLAGNDIVLFGNNLAYDPELPEKAHQALLQLHRDGKISRERIESSYRRIMA